ncbi:MAG: SusD/RagB family nutrient-binding outer membrane lipoprotein [Bacteroidota bacterium]
MKKITSYIIMILVGGLFFSCTKDFSELNTNPNAPTEVNAELLLRRVIYDLGDEMSYEGFVAGNLLGQHFTMVDFNLFDRHNLSQPQLAGNPWPTLYQNLRDVNTLLEQSRTNTAEEVYEGPALVMKSYIGAMLTDIYGNVPYFEAAQGEEGIGHLTLSGRQI